MNTIPTSQPAELIVFVHGMANFAHNRGTKADQERLLQDRLDQRHGLRGAFDDSGNYAFVSELGSELLRGDVVSALRAKYDIAGVVVVPRAVCANSLVELEQLALARYDRRFRKADYAVTLNSERWRLGLVFTDLKSPLQPEASNQLLRRDDDQLKTLFVRDRIVGVLKYDQGKRIPWGVPASFVKRTLRGSNHALLATGRSAKTVRGALELLRRLPAPDGKIELRR